MDIGIQCEKAVQQFTKQRDITFSGKAVTVQRHLNIHATQQKASFITLSVRFLLWLLTCASIFCLFLPFVRKDRLGIYDLLSHSAPVTK